MDWTLLEEMRGRFLGEDIGRHADYWRTRHQLEQYDRVFAERIGWKWDAVICELEALAWQPPDHAQLFDWGCGTAIAARRMVGRFSELREVRLWDRSSLAMELAAERLRAFGAEVVTAGAGSSPVILLVSHVINELDDAGREGLLAEVRAAHTVIWVEPGTPSASRALVDIRESLRGELIPWAPCPHRERCGMTAAANARHWCHFFAEPPNEVFTSALWREVGQRLKLDLRSLPVSYLVLDRRPPPRRAPQRLIGRARVHKGDCTFLACEAAGVTERKVLKRNGAEEFKRIKEGGFRLTF